MRFLFIAVLTAFTLAGCALEVEYSRSGHYHHHRGYHHHHYWNDAGEAYSEAASIRSLTVLPVKLPSSFKTSAREADEKKWREEWPARGAHLVAVMVSAAVDIHVKAVPSATKPTSGYYMEIEVTEYDPGDMTRSNEGRGTEGWSKLNATGKIYNAESGKLVVDMAFDEEAERSSEEPVFEAQVSSIGQNLVSWFREKQTKSSPTGSGSGK